jgi:hypothetical protein
MQNQSAPNTTKPTPRSSSESTPTQSAIASPQPVQKMIFDGLLQLPEIAFESARPRVTGPHGMVGIQGTEKAGSIIMGDFSDFC